MNAIRSNNVSSKYQRFTSSGCKDIGFTKTEFVTKTQFLKNFYVLLIGGSLDRFVHDTPVKQYKICLSFYQAAIVLHRFRNSMQF